MQMSFPEDESFFVDMSVLRLFTGAFPLRQQFVDPVEVRVGGARDQNLGTLGYFVFTECRGRCGRPIAEWTVEH